MEIPSGFRKFLIEKNQNPNFTTSRADLLRHDCWAKYWIHQMRKLPIP